MVHRIILLFSGRFQKDGTEWKNQTRDPFLLTLLTGFHGFLSPELSPAHGRAVGTFAVGEVRLFVCLVGWFLWAPGMKQLRKSEYIISPSDAVLPTSGLSIALRLCMEREAINNHGLKCTLDARFLFSKSKLVILPLSLKKCCWLAVCYFLIIYGIYPRKHSDDLDDKMWFLAARSIGGWQAASHSYIIYRWPFLTGQC